MKLNGQRIVILGGSSGIGLATAKAAEAEGAQVIVTGRSRDRLEAAQATLGSGARTVALDVADEAGTRALFQELGRVDHIFITAGTVALDSRLAPDSASLRPAMDTRFWGAFSAAKYGAAKMNAGGSIRCFMGSNRFHVDMPRHPDLAPPRLPRIRTCEFVPSGSSVHGFAT